MQKRDRLVGNARIAAALLDVLAAEGDAGARSRVWAALGGEGASLGSESWIKDATLRALWRAGGGDPERARRVGRELLAPGALGLFFAYSGIATVEKAYRRCDQWLAREATGVRYVCERIEEGEARVRCELPPEGEAAEAADGTCALRLGMLEAVPGLFGLLPARVQEVECRRRGDAACVYEARWSRHSRRGLLAGGLAAGFAAGVAIGLGGLSGRDPLELGLLGLAALGFTILGAAAGRSADLARQLAAVAGARRGQLALLEQADSELAERIDEMAKVDSALEAAPPAPRPGPGGGGEDASPVLDRQRELGVRAADELRESTRALRGVLGDLPAEGEAASALRCELDRLESLRVSLGHDAREGAAPQRESADLAAIVRGALELVRERRPAVRFEWQVDEPLPRVVCDPFQIEQMVVQLLENAAAASHEVQGAVRIGLTCAARCVELSVEDEGPGLDEELVDATFDPFSAPQRAGSDVDFGWTVSYRIVREHGGELRMESRPGRGTRITAALPTAD